MSTLKLNLDVKLTGCSNWSICNSVSVNLCHEIIGMESVEIEARLWHGISYLEFNDKEFNQ